MNETNILALEQAVAKQEKDIDRISAAIEGIPQRITTLEASVERLCNTIDKLLDKSDTKYQTKELCDSICKSCHKSQNETQQALDDIRTDQKWTMRGFITSLAIIAWQLIMLHLGV